jgi:predicted alpha/beta-fold hydrolase
MNYVAPWWLPGGNSQTIWAALRARRFLGPVPVFRRERWSTPDSDFVDVDWLVDMAPTLVALRTTLPAEGAGLARGGPALRPPTCEQPLLVVFHGLEGSSSSHYAEAFSDVARLQGWACAVPHFRGCSGEINLAPRAYHSGDFAEIDWLLRRFAVQHAGPVVAVGISLGGNALMRWASEMGAEARQVVAGIASVCSPLDLAASGRAIGRGFNRQVYTRMFLKSMVPKALKKLDQYPGLFDREMLLAARDLYDFDNVFTAPLHGFKDAKDYWGRASAKPHLHQVAVPALALNALNDPFVPASSLPQAGDVSRYVTLWQPEQGGHVGFVSSTSPGLRFPGHVRAMPEAVTAFLAAQL